jgi:membrane protease YdiL (CAAX protease family)
MKPRAWGAMVRPEALWILVAAILLAGPARPPTVSSTYIFEWGGVATLILSFLGRTHRPAAIAATLAPGLAGAYLAAAAAIRALGLHPKIGHADWAVVAGGLIALTLSAGRYPGRIGALRRRDPVVFTAIQLFVGLAARWAYYALGWDAIGPASFLPYTIQGAFTVELPLFALALAGVGLGISRDWRSAASRLGLRRPRLLTVGVGLTVTMVINLIYPWVALLNFEAGPTTYFKINAIVRYAQVSDLKTLVFLALAAGLCEETLFRGALLPRAGILFSAVAFGLIHIQYGPSSVFLVVVVDGVIFGLLRRYLDTTAAITAHAAYDLPVAAYGSVGIGLAVGLTLIAVGLMLKQRTVRGVVLEAVRRLKPSAIMDQPGWLRASAAVVIVLVGILALVWSTGPHLNSSPQHGGVQLMVANYPRDTEVEFYLVEPTAYASLASTTTDAAGTGSAFWKPAFGGSHTLIVTACLTGHQDVCPASALVDTS